MYKKRNLIRSLLLLALTLHLGIITYFWWQSSGFYLTSGNSGLVFIALGRLLGLIGVTFALQQFVLIGRLPILEKAFGQDAMSRTHQLTGYITFSTIILHPFFIVLGNAIVSNEGLFAQYWFLFRNYEDVWKASLAMFCLMAVVVSSVWIVRNRLKYQWWYGVHLLTYAFILLAFGHQNNLGTTVNFSQGSRTYWYAMYVVVLGIFGYFRIVRPLWTYLVHGFRVTNVVQESPDVISIFINGRNMEKYKWKPGQFAIFTFLFPGSKFESHPFSISNLSDDSKTLRITVKAVGDYTKNLQNIQAGVPVIIQGPYGIYGKQIKAERQVVLIAGGIGITPLRCLFERYARSGRYVTLIYAAKTLDDLVFKWEIDEIAREFTKASVHYFVQASDASYDQNIHTGRITDEKLAELVDSIHGRKAFVCGPPAMMNETEKMLGRLGIPKEKIITERFSLHR